MAAGDLYNAFAGDLRRDTRERAAIIRAFMEDETRRDAPHLSGRLRSAITCSPFREEFDRFVATIKADEQAAPQARYTDSGTGEYAGQGRIYPTSARALVFFWYRIGRLVAFASVRGIPAQHWWDGPAGGRMEERLRDACAAAYGD